MGFYAGSCRHSCAKGFLMNCPVLKSLHRTWNLPLIVTTSLLHNCLVWLTNEVLASVDRSIQLHVLFSGSDIDMIPNVTTMATRISSPIGRNKPNNASPSLSAKIHMYATDMMATANQQLTTIAALDSIFWHLCYFSWRVFISVGQSIDGQREEKKDKVLSNQPNHRSINRGTVLFFYQLLLSLFQRTPFCIVNWGFPPFFGVCQAWNWKFGEIDESGGDESPSLTINRDWWFGLILSNFEKDTGNRKKVAVSILIA